MKTTTKKQLMEQMLRDKEQYEASLKQLNEEREGATMSSFTNYGEIDFTKMMIKALLAVAYGWTLGICAGSAIDAMLMLSIPAFGQLAIAIAIMVLAVGTAWATSGFVTESVYNGGAVACDYAQRGYHKVLNMFKREPALA